MDRDQNWERTQDAYRTMCDSTFKEDNRSYREIIEAYYNSSLK